VDVEAAHADAVVLAVAAANGQISRLEKEFLPVRNLVNIHVN
jgi:hypothetical protein